VACLRTPLIDALARRVAGDAQLVRLTISPSP
jgi:hypothetical protein